MKKAARWPPGVPRPTGPVIQALDTRCACGGLPALYRLGHGGWSCACTACGKAIPEPAETRKGAAESWLSLRGVQVEIE